jgi:hypothetical protein
LEEASDLSYDRLLMMMMMIPLVIDQRNTSEKHWWHDTDTTIHQNPETGVTQ